MLKSAARLRDIRQLTSDDLLAMPESEYFTLRHEVTRAHLRGEALYACALCSHSVYAPLVPPYRWSGSTTKGKAAALLDNLSKGKWPFGVRGYVAHRFGDALHGKGVRARILGRKSRNATVRQHIEILFERLKGWRRVAIRNDRRRKELNMPLAGQLPIWFLLHSQLVLQSAIRVRLWSPTTR